MTAPIITGGTRPSIAEKAPPPLERTKAHKWLTAERAADYKDSELAGFELYISKLAEEKIRNHALRHVDERREVMGLMLGSIHLHNGKEYALVRDVATTDLDATSVSVKFDRSGFEKLFESLDDSGFNYVIVGWYHSHPSWRCFMSATDIQSQRALFDKRYHTAVVIDPISKEIDAFFLENGKVETRPFAIYWDEYQNPYYGTSVRMRKV